MWGGSEEKFMRWMSHSRSKFSYLGILAASVAAVVFLSMPHTALSPRKIAEALAQRVKSGNTVSQSEIEQLFGAPYERVFDG